MSGTYMRDYANLTPEQISAWMRAVDTRTTEPAPPADEPTPQGWRLNLLTVGTVAGGLLMLVGGVCLGLLFGARPESEGLTDAELWTQNTDLMASSAFAVIALFLGAVVLLFVGVGHFIGRMYRARTAASERAERERRQLIDLERVAAQERQEIMKAVKRLAASIETLHADQEEMCEEITAMQSGKVVPISKDRR